MKIKKIYFDMDGVLANFDLGVVELAKTKVIRQDSILENEMWDKIRSVDHFYDKLKIMPGAKEMFDYIYNIYGDKCEVLTGIPKPHRGIITASEDKTNWMHRELAPSIKVNTVYKENKKNFCTGIDCILIDDYEKNIESWIESGGTGILYKDPLEVIEFIKSIDNK